MKKVLMCMALVGLCATLAYADKPAIQQLGNPQKVTPLSYQQIGTDMKPVGPVYQYQGGIAQGTGTLVYDGFEPGPLGGPTDGRYNVNCGMGGMRWYFGSGYRNPDQVNDMTLCPGNNGVTSDHQEFAWFWEQTEDCYVVIFPTEDFDFSCYTPPFTTAYNGIAWFFGTLPPGGGYYYSDPTASFSIQMPMDGAGGYYTIFSNKVTSTAIYLATMVQPMLWGTKDPLNTYYPQGTSCSHQDKKQWDDDSPADGIFIAAECYNYDYGTGVCPGILGSMMAFYKTGVNQLRCDANCDTYFDGADIDPFFELLADPAQWQIDFPGCDPTMAGDANCDTYVDGADIDPFFAGLQAGVCTCP